MVFEHEYLTFSWLALACSWLYLTFSLLDLNCFLLCLGCILISFHTKVAVVRALGIGKKINVFECEYWICFWLDLTCYWLDLTCSLLDLLWFLSLCYVSLTCFIKIVAVIRALGIDKKNNGLWIWILDMHLIWLNLFLTGLDLFLTCLTCILLSL